jgi:hypothetical protein
VERAKELAIQEKAWMSFAKAMGEIGRPNGATSGTAAREEVTKTLRRFGWESVGFVDDICQNTMRRDRRGHTIAPGAVPSLPVVPLTS